MTSRSRPVSRAQLGRELASAEQRIEALEAELCQLSQQRDLLLQEMNHRVGNNLAVLLAILDSERSAAAAEASMRISRFILGLAAVQRLLSETRWRPLPLAALCRAILQAVVAGVKPEVRALVADSTIEVTSRVADRIAVILSELALNSLRHCRELELVEIEVRLRRSEGQIELTYRDSGPGYPAEVCGGRLSRGGLGLISELACHGLDGSLALSNGPGATATLTFSAGGSARVSGTPDAGRAPLACRAEGACNGGLQ